MADEVVPVYLREILLNAGPFNPETCTLVAVDGAVKVHTPTRQHQVHHPVLSTLRQVCTVVKSRKVSTPGVGHPIGVPGGTCASHCA